MLVKYFSICVLFNCDIINNYSWRNMSELSIDDMGIKISVVDKIIDKKGKVYFIEVKFTKDFFSKYFKKEKNHKVSDFIKKTIITSREMQVLKYISEGKNNSEIASYLNVSVHTAKVHIQNIFKKLYVTDRTEAVVRAIKLGLIEI